jgi:hypothetical protein
MIETSQITDDGWDYKCRGRSLMKLKDEQKHSKFEYGEDLKD